MADRFDEMARHLNDHAPYCVCDPCMAIGRALRETDAKAREEERERCIEAMRERQASPDDWTNCPDRSVDHHNGHCSCTTIWRLMAEVAADPTCATCGGTGVTGDGAWGAPVYCDCAAAIRAPEPEAGGEACATEPLYTFTADGSEGSPPAPGFEEACKRGDVVEREPASDCTHLHNLRWVCPPEHYGPACKPEGGSDA